MPYLSDPKIWGPGAWFNIHLFAAKATDTETKEFYVQYINTIVRNLPCMDCRRHATRYLKDNPLRAYMVDRDPKGLFRWSWTFHNFVNTRLHKPHVSWETAKEMFYNDSGVCAGDCGSLPVREASVYSKPRRRNRIEFRDW